MERQEQVQDQRQEQVQDQVQDSEQLIERVAALDIGKAMLVCCTRVPGENGKRLQQVSEHATMTRALGLLADRLLELGVTRVVMEATSDYWDSRELHQTGAGMGLSPRLAA